VGEGWIYEPDPRRKHSWNKPMAGFVEVNGVQVAMCSSLITIEIAQRMLDEGYRWVPIGSIDEHPQRIYAIFDGVVYRATPTVPGTSYHGFPEIRIRLPPDPGLKQWLLERATELDCRREVEAWIAGR
jgi:hypothetical protein